MLTRERLRKLIEEYGLARVTDQIMADVKPCIRLKLNYTPDETIPIGASKMGGSPDVPADFEWATWNSLPLTFIAQIRLSDAKPFDEEDLFPESGLLYFFFAQEAFGNMPYEAMLGTDGPYRVIYLSDEQTPLMRTLHPLADKNSSYDIHEYQAATLSLDDDLSLIFRYSLINPDIGRGEQTFLAGEEQDKYVNCWIAAEKELSHPLHQLLGYEYDVQNIYQATINAHAAWQIGEPKDWILLFQVDTDDVDRGQDKPSFLWGDGGLIHYCINKHDLHAGKYDRVWLDCIGT